MQLVTRKVFEKLQIAVVGSPQILHERSEIRPSEAGWTRRNDLADRFGGALDDKLSPAGARSTIEEKMRAAAVAEMRDFIKISFYEISRFFAIA